MGRAFTTRVPLATTASTVIPFSRNAAAARRCSRRSGGIRPRADATARAARPSARAPARIRSPDGSTQCPRETCTAIRREGSSC